MKIFAHSTNDSKGHRASGLLPLLCAIILTTTEKSSAQVTIISPLDSSSAIAGDTLRIQWDDELRRAADLSYSLDSGKTWSYLVNNYKSSLFLWKTPDISPRKILVQIQAPSAVNIDIIASRNEMHDLREITSARFAPDGKTFVTVGKDGNASFWNSDDLDVRKDRLFGDARAAVYYHNADSVAIAAGNHIIIFDRDSGKSIKVNTGSAVRAIAAHPVKPIVASGSDDGKVTLWDMQTQQAITTFSHPEMTVVNTITFSPNGERLMYSGDFAAGESSAKIFIQEISKGTLLTINDAHGSGGNPLRVWSCAFSPDGRLAASGGADRTLKVWDLATLSARHSYPAFRKDVRAVCYSPDGRKVVGGSMDSTVRAINAASGQELFVMPHGAEVYAVDYSPSGDTLISTGDFGSIRLWSYTAKDNYQQNVFLKQAVRLRVPQLRSIPRKITAAEFSLDAYSDSEFIPKPVSGTAIVQIPSDIIELQDRQNYTITNSGTPFDTLTLSKTDLLSDAGFARLLLRIRDNGAAAAQMKVLSFEISDSSEFVPVVENDSIAEIAVDPPYRFKLTLAEKTVGPGEKTSLPLALEMVSAGSGAPPAGISFTVKFDAPGDMISFDGLSRAKGRDSLSLTVQEVQPGSSVLTIPITALSSDLSQADIAMRIEYSDTADYILSGGDGKVLIDPSCNSERRVSVVSEVLGVSARPNPASDIFFVDFSSGEDGETTLELIDLQGNSILLMKENLTHGSYTRQFSAKGMPRGRYQLVMKTPGSRISATLLIAD